MSNTSCRLALEPSYPEVRCTETGDCASATSYSKNGVSVENASQSSVLQQLQQRLAQNNSELSAAAAGLADPQALADTSVLRLLVLRGSRAAVGNPAAPPL